MKRIDEIFGIDKVAHFGVAFTIATFLTIFWHWIFIPEISAGEMETFTLWVGFGGATTVIMFILSCIWEFFFSNVQENGETWDTQDVITNMIGSTTAITLITLFTTFCL